MAKIILFIEGVYTRDITDSLSESDSESLDDIEEISNFDVIPHKYTSLSTWILQTNTLCGHCGMKFDTVPIFIPKYLDNTSGNLSIVISKMLFCSFPCAAKYIEDTSIGADRQNKQDMLKFIYKEFTGLTIDSIPHAPDKSEIDTYAGGDATYTSNSFKKLISKMINQHYHIGKHVHAK